MLEWTDDAVFDNSWINQDVVNQMIKESKQPGADMIAFYTHIADVIDYEILWEYGGVYLNTDLKPLKPLSKLDCDKERTWFAKEDDYNLVNMAMFAPRHDPFIGKIIELLPRRYFGSPGAFMNYSTGCGLIMEAYSQMPNAVQALHRDVFNPIHFTDFGYGEEPSLERAFPENTVAVHLWGHRSNQRGQRILET